MKKTASPFNFCVFKNAVGHPFEAKMPLSYPVNHFLRESMAPQANGALGKYSVLYPCLQFFVFDLAATDSCRYNIFDVQHHQNKVAHFLRHGSNCHCSMRHFLMIITDYIIKRHVYSANRPVAVFNCDSVIWISLLIIIIIIIMAKKISHHSGDELETAFLFQRVSVLVQRFNGVLLHDSFVFEDCPE